MSASTPAPDSVAGLAAGLARGDFSAEEAARRFLARIEALDPRLNSFVTVTAERDSSLLPPLSHL